eukprot:scaffold17419_cov54-Phaeocystis_antarctica.AAC.2
MAPDTPPFVTLTLSPLRPVPRSRSDGAPGQRANAEHAPSGPVRQHHLQRHQVSAAGRALVREGEEAVRH